jgi:TPR repeat protein
MRPSVLAPSRQRSDGLDKRLLQAAEAGDAAAQYNLGILYDSGIDDNGRAVKGNQPQAARWLLAAAEQGLPRAQVKLAEVYAAAGGHAAAGGWFLLAALGLHGVHRHRARSGYDRIASVLTAAQIVQAKRFAEDWTPTRRKQPDAGGADGRG